MRCMCDCVTLVLAIADHSERHLAGSSKDVNALAEVLPSSAVPSDLFWRSHRLLDVQHDLASCAPWGIPNDPLYNRDFRNLHIALNYLLCSIPLGVAAVAWSTVLSQFVAACLYRCLDAGTRGFCFHPENQLQSGRRLQIIRIGHPPDRGARSVFLFEHIIQSVINGFVPT